MPSLKSSSRQQIQNSLLVLKSLLAQSRIFSGRETAGINQQLEQKQTDTLHPYLQRLFNQLSKKTLAIPPNQPLTTPSQRLTTTPKTTDTATEDLSLDDFKLELTKQADSAIARITTMQLNQLIKSDDETHWQLELPIRNEQDIDVLTLTIDKEKSSTQDEANFLWKMGLTFNFKKMGNPHARIMLSGEKASVTFWAEKQPTAELIQNNLDLLEAGLKLTGLAVGTLSCQVGTAPPTNTNDISQGTLLNEKA